MKKQTVTVLGNLLLALVAVVGLTRCGVPGPARAEISVADHADALTTAAGDNLFSLTLTKAAKSYDLASVSVTAGLPGETASVMNFTHADANSNGKLDQGEALTVKEPIVNLFDSGSVGKAVKVTFDEKEEGIYFAIGSATWTPTN